MRSALAAVTPLTWYAAVLVLLVGALPAALAASAASLDAPLWAIAALSAVSVLAERQSVRIAPHTQMSVAALPILFAAVVYGPYVAMIVGGFSVVFDCRRPYTRWVIWTCSRSLVGGLAGAIVLFVPADRGSFGGLLLAVTLAVLTEGFADICLNSVTVWLRRTASFGDTMRAMSRLLLSTAPLYTPVVAALAYAYQELSPWTVLLFFVPALAAQRLLVLYEEQRKLAQNLSAVNERLERANLSFASALVAALDARDQYTAGHSAAVAVYSRDIAAGLGLDEEQQQLAHLCGLLHDIGKVGIAPGIVEKAGPLTPEERRQMEEHAVIGERILANVDDYAEIAKIVRHHHERVDGSGYPDGLEGDDIPLISRIIGVADAYSAMTSARPYRRAMASRLARARLAKAAETQFDPDVVRAFEAILSGSTTKYLRGARPDFAVEAQRHIVLVPVEPAATAAA